jgi:predicted DNA-binding transcriptional regulator AlpA
MTDQPQLLTVKEVAALSGLGVSTVWLQAKKGNFPAPIKIGGSTRWRRTDVEALFSTTAA